MNCCNESNSVKLNEHFSLLDGVEVSDNNFEKRIYKNEVYKISSRINIPDYVGNIYQLKSSNEALYFNDKKSIYRFKDGKFKKAYTPNKGRGPQEIPQIFRFDIRDDVIAIAGYPEMRVLIHQIRTDTTKLIMTNYRGNVLIDKRFNFYGENTSNPSSFMITKFDANGDSLNSFGQFFNNQNQSLNMFDYYWDYNQKHDLIIIGFMSVGYYIALDTDGNIKYVVESIQYPGRIPLLVNRNGMRYVDDEGKIVMSGLTTNNDEFHVYTAKAMNNNNEIYGAVIDVLDVKDGSYKFSYVIKEPLHWPIELLDNYSLVSITDIYELVKWERYTSTN